MIQYVIGPVYSYSFFLKQIDLYLAEFRGFGLYLAEFRELLKLVECVALANSQCDASTDASHWLLANAMHRMAHRIG